MRYERDAGGHVVTLDYQQASDRKGRWRLWALLGGAGAAAAAIAAALNPFGTGRVVSQGSLLATPANVSSGVVMGDWVMPEDTVPPDFMGPPAPGTSRQVFLMGALASPPEQVATRPDGLLGPPAPHETVAQDDFTADPR